MTPELRAQLESWRDAPPGDDLVETRRRHAVWRLSLPDEPQDDAARAAALIAADPPTAPVAVGGCCG